MDAVHAALLVEVTIEIPLVLFTLATLRCVILKARTKTLGFATDFFMLYAVQSAADLGDYFVVRRATATCLCVFVNFPIRKEQISEDD